MRTSSKTSSARCVRRKKVSGRTMYLNVDSERVYVYSGGKAFDAALRCIVFVHGAGDDHSVWGLQSRYFAHHGRCVLVPDLPGHGRSAGRPRDNIAALAEWLLQLMEAAGVATAAIVGHSMGSLIGIEIAARNPSRVNALALLGTAFPMVVSESLLRAAEADEHVAFEMINAWAHSPGARLGGDPVPGFWMSGGSVRLLERSRSGALYLDLKACNDYSAGLTSAAEIRCSTLAVLGAADQMASMRAARSLLGALPQVKTVVLASCGHAMMSEQPDAVLDVLLQFLSPT